MLSRGLQGLRAASALQKAMRGVTSSTVTPASLLFSSRGFSGPSWLQKASQPEQSEIDEVPNLDTRPQWSLDPRTQATRLGSNWTYDKELFALAHRLGYSLADLPRLQAALTHRSALAIRAKEEGRGELGPDEQNSRLAFLGKVVTQYFVTEHLLATYPNVQGDGLSDMSAFLLNDNALVKCADYVGITELIRAQKRLDDPKKKKITVRALLATVACLQLDQGPAAARKFVHEFIISKMAGVDLHEILKIQHPKFMLQGILASQGLPAPQSMLLRESGRATHFPTFVVGVYSGERLLGEGCGTSLKRAEREACLAALHEHFSKQLASAEFPQRYERERDISFFQLSNEEDEQEN